MSNTRDRILARLRAAQSMSKQTSFEPGQSANGQPATDRAAVTPSNHTEPVTTENLQQFISLLKSSHAEVICSDNSEWPRHLQQVLEPRAVTHWLCSDRTTSGLRWSAHLREHGQPTVKTTHYPTTVETFKPVLFNDIEASLTDTKGGIADTGSLLLEPSADEPRLMSLVPPLHVALVKRSQIVRRFTDLLEQNHWETQPMPR
jgi:L-lactate dehydrogenase complex protein LldG